MHLSGTLLKWTNYFSGWQERWFVLDNGILSYYKSQDDVSSGCKGSVKMSVCDIVVHHSDNTRLDLIIPGEQHFYIKASNAKERQQWLVALGSTKATTGKDIEDQETELLDLLKSKRSELRLYCDLLMQQIHSVKMAVPQNDIPNLETLNQATSLLSPTCDTFIHTLDECMQLVQASMPFDEGPQSPITDATTPMSPHKHPNKKGRQFLRQNSSDRPPGSTRSRTSSVNSQDSTNISRQNSRNRTPSEASGSELSFTDHSIPEHKLSPHIGSSSVLIPGNVQSSQTKDSNRPRLHRKSFSETGSADKSKQLENVNNNFGTSLSSETGSVDKSKQSENVNNNFGTSPSSAGEQLRTSLEQNGISPDESVNSDEGDIFLDPIESRLPSFFSEMKPSFADLKFTEDAGIPVEPFLESCRCLVPIFDKLNATAFAPVKMDFQGNIRKVKTKYSLHPEEFPTLQSIILHEVGNKQQFLANSASMALLWMKRSLEFIVGFLEEVKNGEEDLSVAATNAYSTSLKPYHGWVVRGVFAVAVKALPYRKVFLALLLSPSAGDASSPSGPDFEHALIADIDSYNTAVGVVIQILNEFINLHGLNNTEQI